jgi:hypothetical protein
MLTLDQIEEKIENPVSGAELGTGVSLQNRHKIHITGQGYTDALSLMRGFESNDDFSVRKQLTKPATIQLCALILNNLNRWLTTQGTVKLYKFKQEKQLEAFNNVLKQAWRGGSMDSFIRSFYKDAIYQEMNGFLLITKPAISGNVQIREGVETPYDGSSLDPYIIFIAAEDVVDFHGVGDNLEYLIINYGESNGVQYYRVIDDTQDTIVQKTKERVFIRDEDIKMHEVGYTPAIQISSIAKDLRNDKVKTSPIDHVLPALDRYMQKDSDLIIQMVRHMYPKLASVTTKCKMCGGDGFYYDKDTKIRCKDCNGTGKVIPISRDGILGLPQYIDEGKTPYPGSPASYITPDTASLEIAIEDLKDLAQEILYSATGDKNLVAESLNTATENMINFKGLEDRIFEIVSMVESREQFLVYTIAKMHNDFRDGIESVSVRYGRRLVLRGENEIISEIESAKSAGMPFSHIDALQKELIYSRYKNNKDELLRQRLLADVEPLSGYTVEDIMDVRDYVSDDDIRIKVNFKRLIDMFESRRGPIDRFKPDMEWNSRVQKIYEEIKKLSDEIFIPGGSEGDT